MKTLVAKTFAEFVVNCLSQDVSKETVDALKRAVERDRAIDAIPLQAKAKNIKMDLVSAMVKYAANVIPLQYWDREKHCTAGIKSINVTFEGRNWTGIALVASGTGLSLFRGGASQTLSSSNDWIGGLDVVCDAIGFDASIYSSQLEALNDQYEANIAEWEASQIVSV